MLLLYSRISGSNNSGNVNGSNNGGNISDSNNSGDVNGSNNGGNINGSNNSGDLNGSYNGSGSNISKSDSGPRNEGHENEDDEVTMKQQSDQIYSDTRPKSRMAGGVEEECMCY